MAETHDPNEIVIGAGEFYLVNFTGSQLPEDATVETTANNVGHISAGFTVNYKPTKYEVFNAYGETVKAFVTKEEISCKTGLLSWNLENLTKLSTAEYKTDKVKKLRTLLFTGKGKALPNVLVRFVHIKENGKKIRFTMIGQGGSGFAIAFENKENVIDAELSAVKVLDGFLAKFEEELTEEEAQALAG